jgi:hypothetical protein
MAPAETLYSPDQRKASRPAASSQPTQEPSYPSIGALLRVTVLFVIYTSLLTLLGMYRLVRWPVIVVHEQLA